ncbi:MAG TPA: alpha/beta family hydrolase [Vicinamibacterales bacterium]|nr:alpha/beta family hydrolase [Vicinamibacterales bacterium]
MTHQEAARIPGTSAVRIPARDILIEGDLAVPAHAAGLVIFAHGSGSSRFSRRNRAVADHLLDGGYATLLLDLLTRKEEAVDQHTGQYRFDIPRLADRVVTTIDWAGEQHALAALPIGLFGASTGAAAALMAAAARPTRVRAVISRGGRPDLAGDTLPRVEAPTLLIVGGHDEPVIALNEAARRRLRARSQTTIVPGATHLFEERGALEQVARLALEWCDLYVRTRTSGS